MTGDCLQTEWCPNGSSGEATERQQSGAAAFPRNERHAVLPATELVLRHIRPADVAQAFNGLETVVRDGKPYSCYDRIIDTDNQVRYVLSVGGCSMRSAKVEQVTGFLVDLTDVCEGEFAPLSAHGGRPSPALGTGLARPGEHAASLDL